MTEFQKIIQKASIFNHLQNKKKCKDEKEEN